MITHVVTLQWTPEAPAGHSEVVAAALLALPATIPEIATYACGPDLGAADGNAHFGVVATFASLDDWRVYSSHPDHVQVVTELIRPWLAARMALQFQSA